MTKHTLHLFIFAAAIITSCSESTFEEGATEPGYDYYPLAIGNEWIYEVDSTIYSDLGVTVFESSSFRKEEITDTIATDHYVLTQSSRKSADSPWRVTAVHSIRLTDEQLYRTEFNRRFAKLVFPVRDGRSWDGNASFDDRVVVDVLGNQLRLYEGWMYEMSIVPEAVTVLDNSYSDVIHIQQIDREDAIVYSKSSERYAKGVGLISSSQTYLTAPSVVSPDPWPDKVEQGLIIETRLVSYQ